MSNLPPPPPASPPPPPSSSSWSSVPTPGSWAGETVGGGKPPRPRVVGGGVLTIVGSVIVIISTFLGWLEFTDETVNLWDLQDLENDSADGIGYVFWATATIGLGIALVAAGRVLAVAIIAVVTAAFLTFGALADITDIGDLEDLGIDMGPGPIVALLGGLGALGGAIWALSIRRRWRTPPPAAARQGW